MSKRGTVVALVICGVSATLVGIGLGRFAYSALLPEIIHAGWFSDVQGAYLGAANLSGYLIGALLAPVLAAAWGAARVVRTSLILVVLSFAFCSFPGPFVWFFLWRLLAGAGGALLMVLGPSAVLGRLMPEQRKTAGAIVFSGIGIGILISATLVPALTKWNLSLAWWALTVAASLAVLLTWRHWGRLGQGGGTVGTSETTPPLRGQRLVLSGVLIAYGLDAVGFVPHTVFWVDYLARELGHGTAMAGFYWALLGMGAVSGAFIAALAARSMGWQRALAGGLFVKALATGVPVFFRASWALMLSSLLVGALIPGIVSLTSGRLAELVGASRHRRAWAWATASFAAAQAVTAYAMALLYTRSGSYLPLFEVGAVALFAATVVVGLAPWLQCRLGSQSRLTEKASSWN